MGRCVDINETDVILFQNQLTFVNMISRRHALTPNLTLFFSVIVYLFSFET